jgi:hypothetical protein
MEDNKKRKRRHRHHYGEDYSILSEKNRRKEKTNICDNHIDGA